jgi:phenylalanine-4-hydroxylase
LHRSLIAFGRPFSSSATISSSSSTDHLHQQQHHHPEAAEYVQGAADEEGTDAFFDKTSALMEVEDCPGALAEMLSFFAAHHVNITRLESRPTKKQLDGKFTFVMYIDFDGSRGEAHVDALLDELEQHSHSLLVLDKTEVPWFPRQASQLDAIANRVLDAGVDLTSEHPGFSDPVYRARRGELAEVARKYVHGEIIPRIEYTKEEVETWGAVWKRQEELLQRYACREYLDILGLMKEECGYGPQSIPQQTDITMFLSRRTGFRLRPVAGLLSSRDFLNGLAFRVFFCTQYIRYMRR